MRIEYTETKNMFVLKDFYVSIIIIGEVFNDNHALNITSEKLENIINFISFMIGLKFNLEEIGKIIKNETAEIHFTTELYDTSLILEPDLRYYFYVGLIYAVLSTTIIGLIYMVIKKKK
ncbi:MAG: hypothetical protein ACP5GU_03150 [Thermoprotei archaeon]|jgi:hypothetical protein